MFYNIPVRKEVTGKMITIAHSSPISVLGIKHYVYSEYIIIEATHLCYHIDKLTREKNLGLSPSC